MLQQKQVLLYNFIKSNFEKRSTNIPEPVILALSSDLEFKIHEIAKLTRTIMLKSKRNFFRKNDLISAISLTFNNVLLVNFERNPEEKPIEVLENKIILNVFSNSLVLSFNKVPELNSISKRVYNNLTKCFFDRDEEIFKFALTIIGQKCCLNEVLVAFICTLNERIDQIHNEEFSTRLVMMLERIIFNKAIPVSENPLRDLCISLSFKLLWSVSNFNLKLRVTHILQAIISRQYLLQNSIKKLCIEKLLNEFNQPFLSSFTYCGCLIGLVSLDYCLYMLSDDFISNLWSLPDDIKEHYSVKEAICYLLYKLKVDESLFNISYKKFYNLLDIFSITNISVHFANPICSDYSVDSEKDLSNFENKSLPSLSVTPYATLKREIDLLLQGKTVDDLATLNYEIDDMPPPILFRKSSIQSQFSNNRFTIEDMDFISKSLLENQRKISFKIPGIVSNNQIYLPSIFESEFYNVFHRCHQFIVNLKDIKIIEDKRNVRNHKRNSCAMFSLFYSI